MISKDMVVADIIGNFPYLAEYIMDYGVHCVGCGANEFETLEEGFMGHGMSEDEVDNAVIELNKIIEQNKDTETKNNAQSEITHQNTDKQANISITNNSDAFFGITEEAANKIKTMSDATCFRIKVQNDNGLYRYLFSDENIKNEDDILLEQEGIKILIDEKSMELVKNNILDYTETKGFILERAQ